MSTNWHIENLNDLFYALFRPQGDRPAVIKGQRRLNREDYFRLFFPDALCEQYLTKTLSNLTWFFNSDVKNKAIKHTLMNAVATDCRQVVDEIHHKCMNVLWPEGRHPSFERDELYSVLSSIRIRGELNARLHILDSAVKAAKKSCLRGFFEADPSAALARVILTLSVLPDASEDMLSWIWDIRQQDITRSFLAEENSVEGKMRYGRLLYLNGEHEQAFRAFEIIAKRLSRPAQTVEESAMYCRMATMLLTSDGHYLDRELAAEYMKKALLDDNPASYHLLSQNTHGDEARALLERAASLGHVPALRELGNAWFGGSARLGCERDLSRARTCFQQALSANDADGAYCAYMLGRVYELREDIPSAIGSYRLAKEKGSREAAEKLAVMNWADQEGLAQETPQEDGASQPLRYALINGLSGCNAVFADSLRGAWRVSVCGVGMPSPHAEDGVELRPSPDGDVAQSLRTLGESLFSPERDSFPELVIALLSPDEQDNLSQCALALKVLERLAARLPERKWELVDAVAIYVRAEHDYAALMLDAAFDSVNALYFRVRLCDPDWDSADQLFMTAPIFLPCLPEPDVRRVRLVILGTSSLAMAILRRAISLPLGGDYEVSISVFGEDAALMRQRFLELCPGLESAPPMVFRTMPMFSECALADGGISMLLRKLKERQSGQEINCPEAELLGAGNYYVVATPDDALNIRLGATLRRELLKISRDFTNLPFIAARVDDPIAIKLAQNLSSTAAAGQQNLYEAYQLHCFGASSLYIYARLKDDPIERRALTIHLCYASNPQGEDARRGALSPYYRRQYNRDSSRATAQYLVYHLFLAGIALPSWQLYGAPEEEARLGALYDAWLQDPAHLEAAARVEHVRWNCFMLSMGWEQATPSQVATYVQRGNPGQQNYLARLHPFICDWQRLKSGELIREVEEAIHSRMPEKRVYDPREADADAVRHVAISLAAGLTT